LANFHNLANFFSENEKKEFFFFFWGFSFVSETWQKNMDYDLGGKKKEKEKKTYVVSL
jgi:hypothetical protein